MVDELAQQLEQQIPRLRRYALALVGDPTRADDLVQDCLERAWSRGHLFRPGSDLRAWLFTILHNLHANAARRYNSRRPKCLWRMTDIRRRRPRPKGMPWR